MQTSSVAGELPVGADDPVARHDDAQRIATRCRAHISGKRGVAEAAGQVPVGGALTVGDLAQQIPDSVLELVAADIDRQVEVIAVAGEVQEYGISVMAVSPGTVRTAMTQYVLDSPAGQKWQPGLRHVFEQGRDVPADEAAHLIVYLASGQADVLTGRYLSVSDDVPDLVRRAAQIQADDLYTIRLRTDG